jgi:LAGLIDADG DNA endonuclease family protein
VHDQSVPSKDAASSCEAGDSAAATTSRPRGTDLGAYIAGFVAGEGTFTGTKNTNVFAVMLGEVDAETCELLQSFFGVGHVYHYSRRQPHYDDFVVFQVRKTADLVHVIIPFMDEHLPSSYKRQQYDAWRCKVLDFWEFGMKRRRSCTVDGCERPQRGRGVCRTHYYRLYGR